MGNPTKEQPVDFNHNTNQNMETPCDQLIVSNTFCVYLQAHGAIHYMLIEYVDSFALENDEFIKIIVAL